MNFRRIDARRMFWIYILAVAYLCLYPWRFDPSLDKPLLIWPRSAGRAIILDAILNLALLVPLGVLGRFAYRGARGVFAVLGVATVLTLSVEFVQTMLPGRTSSASDVLTNIVGAGLGLWIAPLFHRYLLAPGTVTAHRRWDVRAMVLLLCCAVGQCFPFIPSFRTPHLKAVIAALPDAAAFPALLTALVTGFLLTALLRQMCLPAMHPLAALGIGAGFLLARVLFPSSIYPGAVLLAGVAGALLGAAVSARFLDRALWLPLLVYLALRQLSPFAFHADAASFFWWPFQGLMELSRQAAVRILFEKTFIYGAVIFYLYRRLGLFAPSAVLCAVILALGELAQMWIPGRTPESLDPLLALLAAGVLRMLPGLAGAGSIFGAKGTDRQAVSEAGTGERE